MRKALILTVIIILFTINVFAQETTTNMQRAVDKICNCLNKIQPDSTNIKKFEEQFMDCFTTSATTELIEISKEKHVEITDKQAMHNIGVEIGLELWKQKCPGYMELVKISARKEMNKVNETIEETATRGIVKRIETKDLVHVILQDKNGREQSFVWLNYFQGSDKYMGDKIKTLVGKEIKIRWTEKEIYLPKAENYFKIKQITGIN